MFPELRLKAQNTVLVNNLKLDKPGFKFTVYGNGLPLKTTVLPSGSVVEIFDFGEEFSPERFFNDGLKNSCSFDLQLGYFSSATISVLAEGFATFIANGGVMRLIINQIVSEEDKEAIQKGVFGDVVDCMDLSDFESLRKTFDEYQNQFFRDYSPTCQNGCYKNCGTSNTM